MKLDLDPAEVDKLYQKNSKDAYGLTIVVGLPFPEGIMGAIESIQRQIEQWLPGRFAWYGLNHLHASIYAPLRSQDCPLRRDNLPPDLDSFTRDLSNVISRWQPFKLTLVGVRLGSNGALVIGEDNLERDLVSRLGAYPNVAPPKHIRGLTSVIGFLTKGQPFGSEEEKARFEDQLGSLQDLPIGCMEVERVWLVHYGSRTLSKVEGKVPFELGRRPSRVPTGAELLAALHIDG